MSTARRPVPARRLILLAAAAAPAVLFSGCGLPAATQQGTSVIVLAASATSNEPEPVLGPPDVGLLRRNAASASDATAYIVDPGTGQPAVVPLTPRRPDGQVQYAQPQRNEMISQNIDRVQRILGREAATGPFDLLAEIAAAARVTAVPGTLIVVSSGLSTAGGFDLRQVGWAASPRSVAARLRRRGMLPSLTGWHVIFSGLGDTAGAQPALPLPLRTLLTSYWMAICRATQAASCAVDEITRPEPPPRSRRPVPVVPVPRVVSVRGPRGWSGKSLPDDEFFAFGSARLVPGASRTLRPLAARARAGHLLVAITGYASPDGGSASYNAGLSLRRAQAVRARLIALGVAPRQIVQVRGLGTAGTSPAACYRRGHLDEAICGRLRRVVILLSPAR